MELLAALWSAVFDHNLVFVQMLSMVGVVLIAERPQDAWRFGYALWASVSMSAFFGWVIIEGILVPWGSEYLAPLVTSVFSSCVILAVGACVGLRRGVANRARVASISACLALNAAVLGAPLQLSIATGEHLEFAAALGNALGAGLGVFLAVVMFSCLRARIHDGLLPRAWRGLPISLLSGSLVCLAFLCIGGIGANLFA